MEESIKIAQQAPLNHMHQFMAELDLDEENFEFYGKYTLYDLNNSIEDKGRTVANEIYGAEDVYFEKKAVKNIDRFKSLDYDYLPVCIAKTQGSLSDNKEFRGAPENFVLTVTDVQLSDGAGFLVIICGNMMLMPGLSKVPAAVNMDVDDNGVISGLF